MGWCIHSSTWEQTRSDILNCCHTNVPVTDSQPSPVERMSAVGQFKISHREIIVSPSLFFLPLLLFFSSCPLFHFVLSLLLAISWCVFFQRERAEGVCVCGVGHGGGVGVSHNRKQ